MCFLNNSAPDALTTQTTIVQSPIDAVTGQIWNPHQLLRPFAEMVRLDRAAVVAETIDWCDLLGAVITKLASDPSWNDFRLELDCMLERVEQIALASGQFVDDVAKVVRG